MEISPRLVIDLDKIIANTKKVVEQCHAKGIEVLGVTKGFSAIPQLVHAMVQGGVDGLADARMENIIDLRSGGFLQPITLLRIPRLSNVAEVVRYVDTSLNSEFTVIKALADAAAACGKTHKIILMVDVGDLREGVLVGNVLNMVKAITNLKGIKLTGIGTNMGCYGGILPSINNLGILVKIAERITEKIGLELEIISGGGTSSLLLVAQNSIPAGINQLRIGEGILLGTDTTNQRRIPGLNYDAFSLEVEVIEVKTKPSVPIGEIGRDAFGNKPEFEDMGARRRAILAIGKQDIYIEGITPIDENIVIMGASSDHLIVDITDANRHIAVGDELGFSVNYAGMLSASQSKYISKVFKGGSECYAE